MRLWIDPPRRLKLVIDHDWEERRARERREMEERYRLRPEPIRSDLPQPSPRKYIHMHHLYRSDGEECQVHCSVAIDLEKRRIDHGYSSDWLFGREHQGSGMIGVALYSLPVTLPLSPLLLAIGRYYSWKEKRQGMSRHGRALLKAVRGQLDAETEALLIEALKNTWQHEEEMSRLVSFEEAKEILAVCKHREEFISADDSFENVEARGFHWYNDHGEHVAQGSFYGQRDYYVRVLGTVFEDDEADALITCYRTREVHDYGENHLSDSSSSPPPSQGRFSFWGGCG